jgi:uncharacterized protein (UPF0335 family)
MSKQVYRLIHRVERLYLRMEQFKGQSISMAGLYWMGHIVDTFEELESLGFDVQAWERERWPDVWQKGVAG